MAGLPRKNGICRTLEEISNALLPYGFLSTTLTQTPPSNRYFPVGLPAQHGHFPGMLPKIFFDAESTRFRCNSSTARAVGGASAGPNTVVHSRTQQGCTLAHLIALLDHLAPVDKPLVVAHPANPVDQDRGESREACPLHLLPDGRGFAAQQPVRGYIETDSTVDATGAGMRTRSRE